MSNESTVICSIGFILLFGYVFRQRFYERREKEKSTEIEISKTATEIRQSIRFGTKKIDEINNDIIEFHRKYRHQSNIKARCGKLSALLANKKVSA